MSSRGTTLTSPAGPVRHTRQCPPGSGQRGQCKRRERTTAAIRTTQYSTVRSVTRTTGHTPVSRAGAHASARSGPQTVAQRRRGLAYTRARARSLVALDGGSDALGTRRHATRLPAALTDQLVDREVPGLGGRLKEPLPCRPPKGRSVNGRHGAHTGRLSLRARTDTMGFDASTGLIRSRSRSIESPTAQRCITRC